MQNKVFIITGSQGSGKTEFLLKVIEKLKEKDINTGGIIARGFWENNVRSGFELIDIQSGEKMMLCQTKPVNGWEKFRRFYFNPKGFDFGNKALAPENLKNADVIVIDEAGPVELEGKGWSDAINRLTKTTEKPMIWVVRKSLTEDIIAHFKINDFTIFEISSSVNKVADIIAKHCNRLQL